MFSFSSFFTLLLRYSTSDSTLYPFCISLILFSISILAVLYIISIYNTVRHFVVIQNKFTCTYQDKICVLNILLRLTYTRGCQAIDSDLLKLFLLGPAGCRVAIFIISNKLLYLRAIFLHLILDCLTYLNVILSAVC